MMRRAYHTGKPRDWRRVRERAFNKIKESCDKGCALRLVWDQKPGDTQKAKALSTMKAARDSDDEVILRPSSKERHSRKITNPIGTVG